MVELTPVRCDRCDDLFYSPEETVHKWNISDGEFDLCSLCDDVVNNYFYHGQLTELTLSCKGIMKHENDFIKEQKCLLEEIDD